MAEHLANHLQELPDLKSIKILLLDGGRETRLLVGVQNTTQVSYPTARDLEIPHRRDIRNTALAVLNVTGLARKRSLADAGKVVSAWKRSLEDLRIELENLVNTWPNRSTGLTGRDG
jgi:hypothetical protein